MIKNKKLLMNEIEKINENITYFSHKLILILKNLVIYTKIDNILYIET